MTDETMIEILALYEMGCEPEYIDDLLELSPGVAAQIIEADVVEFPDEPLRVGRLH